MSVVTNTTTIGAIEAPSRRNTELAMLAFAVLIPTFAYLNVGLAVNNEVPSGMIGYGLGIGLLAGVGHLVVRKFAPYADPLLLPLATLLNGLGLVLIWRLDQSPRLIARAQNIFGASPRTRPSSCSTRPSASRCSSPSCCCSRTTASSSATPTSRWRWPWSC